MRAQVRGQGSREQVGPPQIGFEDLVPQFGGQRVEVFERNPDIPRSVVDQDVDPAARPHHLLDRGVNGHRISLVELHRDAAPPRGAHRIGRRGGPCQVADIGESNICPRSGQSSGNHTANRPRAASDQGCFPCEIHSAFSCLGAECGPLRAKQRRSPL